MTTLLADVASYSVPVNIVFGFIAALMLYGAVRGHHRKRGARRLVAGGGVGGMGGLYILLQAEFVAVTQFMVYIGAIVVLILFGVMLTRTPGGGGRGVQQEDGADRYRHRAAALFRHGVFADRQLRQRSGAAHRRNPTEELSDAIFSSYLLPFELVSVLLLAALIGAIVLARKE